MNLTERNLQDAQKFLLMHEVVQPVDPVPYFMEDSVRFTHVAVDVVQGKDVLFHIIFLATGRFLPAVFLSCALLIRLTGRIYPKYTGKKCHLIEYFEVTSKAHPLTPFLHTRARNPRKHRETVATVEDVRAEEQTHYRSQSLLVRALAA